MFKLLRLVSPFVVALALMSGAPAALAVPAIDAPVHNSAPAAASGIPLASGAAASSSGTSFDWGSAAVGGGGVLLLVALISAGVAVTGRARVTTTR